MKITIEPGPDCNNIDTRVDASGAMSAVMIEPHFARRHGQAVVLYGTVASDDGKLLDRFSLAVSAKTGQILKLSRLKSVKAAVDSPADAPAQETKPNEPAQEGKPPRRVGGVSKRPDPAGPVGDNG